MFSIFSKSREEKKRYSELELEVNKLNDSIKGLKSIVNKKDSKLNELLRELDSLEKTHLRDSEYITKLTKDKEKLGKLVRHLEAEIERIKNKW